MSILVVTGGIHIIDLEQTIPMMRRALTFIRQICDKRGKVALPRKNARLRNNTEFIPSCVMMTDVKQNLPLLRTSLKLRFTIVAVISSDVDPLGIGFPIPANDNLGIYNDLVLGVASDAMESELFSLNRSSVSQY